MMEAVASEAPETDSWTEKLEATVAKLTKLTGLELEVLHHREQDLLSAAACAVKLQEIAKDRKRLEKEVQVAQQAIAQQEALQELRSSIEQKLSAIRSNLGKADFAVRRALVEALVPDLPGYGITLHEDRSIGITGALDIVAAARADGGSGPEGLGSGQRKAAAGGEEAGPSFLCKPPRSSAPEMSRTRIEGSRRPRTSAHHIRLRGATSINISSASSPPSPATAAQPPPPRMRSSRSQASPMPSSS